MFNTPQTGDIVTVVTRYADHYHQRTSDFIETIHENVEVLRPFSWLSNFEFCIPSEAKFASIEMVEKRDRAPTFDTLAMRYERAYTPSNDAPKFDTRVIHMKNVISINGVNVSNEDYSSKTIEVQGSKSTYSVQVEGGVGVSCECKGFQFRKTCRHLSEAEDLV